MGNVQLEKEVKRAVIIAAGKGTRIGAFTRGVPKTLTKFLGMSLLERIVKTVFSCGVEEVIVVTGFGSEHIEEKVKKSRGNIKIVFNDEWEKSNGVSLLKAKEFLGTEPFFLLMSDHIFEPEMLELLRRNYRKGYSFLCIDRNLNEVFDIKDATKVKIEGDGLKDIGKNIEDYNAVDTGVFLLEAAFLENLEEIYREKKDCSITDGVKRAINKGKMKGVDITGRFWIDIDTEEDLKEAKRRFVKRFLYKSTDGIISRNINRKISTLISVPLSSLRFHPDAFTIIVCVTGLLASYFISSSKHIHIILGGILYQLSSILDGVDGELAKMLMKSSKRGEWFDTISDNIVYLAFTAGLLAGVWKTHGLMGLILGLFALSGVITFLTISYIKLIRREMGGSLVFLHRGKLNFLQMMLKRDFFAFIFMLLSFFNMRFLMLLLTFFGAWGGVFWHFLKKE